MRKRLMFAAAAIVGFLAAVSVFAEEGAIPGNANPWGFIYGAHYGSFQTVSATAGLQMVLKTTTSSLAGPFVAVEPGLNGCKLEAGYADLGQLGTPLSAGVAVLRTWRNPWHLAKNQNIPGIEATVGIFGVSLKGEAFYGRRSEEARKRWSFGLSAGVLF